MVAKAEAKGLYATAAEPGSDSTGISVDIANDAAAGAGACAAV